MVVISIENPTDSIKGECTKYLLEIRSGLFVGTISAIVRECLWNMISNDARVSGAVLVYSYNNEQGFMMKMYGYPRRRIVDMDGLKLIEYSFDN